MAPTRSRTLMERITGRFNLVSPGLVMMMDAMRLRWLGPVLSAHKHLIAQELADEEAEKKAKGQARKAKHLVAEKGHVKPANHLELHEKIFIGVATKKEWSSFSML
ncbi:Uncharacterized protein Rs2_17869 [Raphanus sativus]|uniref:Uncharacterized protein LOC108852283 n=1 Tax=Raphanus sativus TaxID=3726 RepID=A0A6J0NAR0_RAPSA|nr:uncharacterized protein LOC108852283 [Raphanus sativus]XP_056863790.1 uncharacterized protein LOC108852283 [Raphanus sativus]KAJ4903918.1 Uncharacterized protein Rs2_17869 [Raphanus sativus]